MVNFRTLENYSPSYLPVSKWINEFKFDWESPEEDPHNGLPRCASAPEIIAKVHNIVLEDWQLKLWEIAKTVEISSEWVYHIWAYVLEIISRLIKIQKLINVSLTRILWISVFSKFMWILHYSIDDKMYFI